MLDSNTPSFEWMFMTKIPKSHREHYVQMNRQPLIESLRKKEIGYTLKKVDIAKLKMMYMEYIFDANTRGMYLCQLESQGGCKNHVVAVDCDLQVILDGCETHAIKLTRSNLNYCCGKYLLGVRKIYLCYEIKKR